MRLLMQKKTGSSTGAIFTSVEIEWPFQAALDEHNRWV